MEERKGCLKKTPTEYFRINSEGAHVSCHRVEGGRFNIFDNSRLRLKVRELFFEILVCGINSALSGLRSTDQIN